MTTTDKSLDELTGALRESFVERDLREAQAEIARLTEQVEQLKEDRRVRTAERSRLKAQLRESQESGKRHRTRATDLQAEIERMRKATARPSPLLSEALVARIIMAELRDRLIGEARRAKTSQIEGALRLAAREVTVSIQTLAERTGR